MSFYIRRSLSPETLDVGGVSGSSCGNNVKSRLACELHGVSSDISCAPVNQHRLRGFTTGLIKQHLPCCHRDDRN